MRYKIDYFKDDNGNYNAQIFLDKLEQKDKRLFDRLYTWIEKIKDSSNHGLPHTESLGDGLFSLRVPKKGGTPRIFFCFSVNQIILLLCGIIKKDMKLRLKDKEQAYNLLKQYRERNKHEKT